MNKGFFKKYDHPGTSKKHPCERCKLYRGAQTPRMKPTGEGKKKMWVHGEGAGKEEDKHGKQFHEKGAAGALLRKKLRALDIDLDEDCWKDNGVRCRTPNNRTPTDTELKLCQNWILPDIREHQPEKILLFGGGAIKSLITTRVPGQKFNAVKKWVGWKIPDQQLQSWIYPLWHPQYLNYNKDEKALWLKFDQFLQEAVEHQQDFIDYSGWAKSVEIIKDPDAASAILTSIIQHQITTAFDWETTALKPHAEGHRIVTGAICLNNLCAIAFPMFDNRRFLNRLKRWLRDSNCKKYAHSKRMEDSWARNTLDVRVRGIVHDTMEATHVLDNRPDINSLEFQTYINYGIAYKDETKKYLKPTDADEKKYGANAFNRIDQAPLDKLLLRNGADSLFTYWLAQDQMKQLQGWAVRPYELMHKGSDALINAHEKGILINRQYCQVQDKKLGKTVDRLTDKINDSTEVKKWKQAGNTAFNPDSDVQLKKLYNDILGKKLDNVSKDALNQVGTQFAKDIVHYRHMSKVKNTYLGGFMREAVDDIMHPFFPTHLVATFRGSSSDPNFTNIPIRDKKARRITRKALRARLGRQILDVDYGRIEVFMGYFNTHDPVLGEYLTTPGTDMHRDMAMQIYLLKKEQVVQDIRDNGGKSGYVFPTFYGSYSGSTALNCWKVAKESKLADGTPLTEHLYDRGIKSYRAFEKHMEDIDDDFWNRRFMVYRDWKEDMWKFYQKHGYIELLTGFRCYWSPKGLLGRKECMNYPNQGPAFHALLWSLTQLEKLIYEERGWNSWVMGQIHDDLVWDIDPSELRELKPVIRAVMCYDIQEHWPWITIPLEIDGKITEIGGNWYEQENIEL